MKIGCSKHLGVYEYFLHRCLQGQLDDLHATGGKHLDTVTEIVNNTQGFITISNT